MNSKIIINRAGRIYINIDATKKNIFGDAEGILYVSYFQRKALFILWHNEGWTLSMIQKAFGYSIKKICQILNEQSTIDFGYKIFE